MKLALGTAQFGLPYGIANQGGQVGRDEVRNILSLARDSGIDTLDTAIAYGDSEACLGEIGADGFKVVTKLPAIPDTITDVADWVRMEFRASLQRLGLDKVYGLLLHRSKQLSARRGQALAESLAALKAEGLAEKIGVSIYAPEELEAVTPVCPIDLVQAPLNLLDRRMVSSGWLQRLNDMDVEVHVRSAFLQGLLLMPRARIPAKFERWAGLWDAWHAWISCNAVSPVAACLHYVQSLPQVDRVVVGVDSVVQLRELLLAASGAAGCLRELPALGCLDEDLINPSNWPR